MKFTLPLVVALFSVAQLSFAVPLLESEGLGLVKPVADESVYSECNIGSVHHPCEVDPDVILFSGQRLPESREERALEQREPQEKKKPDLSKLMEMAKKLRKKE
ncbi:hypothetical protein FPV67DRAFT_1447900 [Lyophyllum atratum]|nr:hypothetical protein FPV67DRAFT_1447900 [Lyophyllum atratum]